MTHLFRSGPFTLHSGGKSPYLIDCSALSHDDWRTLAETAVPLLPPFGTVEGIPRGGLAFAAALRRYESCTCGHHHYLHSFQGWMQRPVPCHECGCEKFTGIDTLLIADDVLTTGRSMEEWRRKCGAKVVAGVVAFARTVPPPWITPRFLAGEAWADEVWEAYHKVQDLKDTVKYVHELEAALKPFARYAAALEATSLSADDDEPMVGGIGSVPPPTVGDCRRALEVMEGRGTE